MTKLLNYLQNNEILQPNDFIKGFGASLEMIEDIDIDIPFASKYLSNFIANSMVTAHSIPVSFLQTSLEPFITTGKASSIASMVFDSIAEIKGEPFAKDLHDKSSFKFSDVFPKDKNSEEEVNKFLETKGLGWLTGAIPLKSPNTSFEHSEEEDMQKLIALQTAEGYWRLTPDFGKIMGFELAELKSETPASLWATSLALEFLEFQFKDLSEEWELVHKKAKTWMLEQIESEELDTILEQARKLFM